MSPPFLILLGAGASATCGLPTANGLTNDFKTIVAQANNADLKGALALVLGGIGFLRGCRGEYPSPSTNIEEVAETIDAILSRRTSQLAPYVGAWNDALARYDLYGDDKKNALIGLKQMLLDCLSDRLETPAIGNLRHFQAPVQGLLVTYSCLHIFTLNYDRTVETALDDQGITHTSGFTQNGWTASEFDKAEYKVRIYKLHGSLDWYKDEEDQVVYSTVMPPEDREPASPYPPLLIFGMVNKMQSIDPFLHLFFTFSDQLKKTKLLVAVGYSFGDNHINQMIFQAMSLDDRKRIIAVDLNSTTAEETYRRNFSIGASFADAGRVCFAPHDAKEMLERDLLKALIEEQLELATTEGPF